MPRLTSTAAVLLEAVVVAAAAAGFAFAANQFSPRGLNLGRDYFPITEGHKAPLSVGGKSVLTNEDSEAAGIRRQIEENGLRVIDRAEAERLFHDPRSQQGMVVFVDARGEASYAQAHIPGAYQLDRYHPEKYLAADLVPCRNADLAVVYCTGSDCDDAEYTALLLRDAGVPSRKLLVYQGGFDEWSANQLPLEQGARNSGLAPAGIP